MKVFYENLVDAIENYYWDKSTVNNILYLEDIIPNYEVDIYVQRKKLIENTVSYDLSKIELNGIPKCRNHLYFVNYYKAVSSNFEEFKTNENNVITLRVKNVDISQGTPFLLDVILNSVHIETLEYSDEYALYNKRQIQIYSDKLGVPINITQPLYLLPNEEVSYTFYTINVTEEPSVHKYLCVYDSVNNALVFDKAYNDNSINVVLQSRASILRANTINDIYATTAQSFVHYDEKNNRVAIPVEKFFKSGSKLKYIKTQQIEIDPHQLNIGYNLIGIYLDRNSTLQYDPIISKPNYATLIETINNYSLDTKRKNINYFAFIIGLNNINSFTAIDVNLMTMAGVGSGGGGGGIEKIIHEFTDVDILEYDYSAGNEVPTIVVYDSDGNQIVPERVNYNLNDKIVIEFGELVSGIVSII